MSDPAPRVALVLGTSTGGVGVHVLSLAGHLVRAGWSVTVCAPASTHAHFDFGATGADVAVVPIRSAGAELLAVPALRRGTAGADLVHAHGLRAGTAAVLSRRRPLVLTWHNAVLARGWAGSVLGVGERLAARAADVSVGASTDLLERVRDLGGRDVRLIPVSPPAPVPLRTVAAVRAEFGLADGQPLVVGVGRLHPQKAHHVLVEAAARWRARVPPPLVVIAGAGPLRADLQRRIDATGAAVRLLGRREDVADLLAAADVVVLASVWEARPLALQEAMRLGRPVVATAVGGVPGLVGSGAVLIAAGDVTALEQTVGALLDDPTRRATLGRRAREQAARWPDEATAAGLLMDVYREVLGRA